MAERSPQHEEGRTAFHLGIHTDARDQRSLVNNYYGGPFPAVTAAYALDHALLVVERAAQNDTFWQNGWMLRPKSLLAERRDGGAHEVSPARNKPRRCASILLRPTTLCGRDMDREFQTLAFMAWFVDLNHPVPSTCELQQRHGAEQHEMLHSLSLSLHRPPVGSQKHAWTERGCMISGGQLSQPNGGVRGDVIWYSRRAAEPRVRPQPS